MIAALVSSYREGPPFSSTLRSTSVPGIDFVLVDDSPVEGAAETGDPTPLPRNLEYAGLYVSKPKVAADDAAKRTRMLNRAKTIANEKRGKRKGGASLVDDPLWVLWLDGDELLLFGEYLRDLLYRADFELEGTAGGGVPIRLVELDGSVSLCTGKLIRAEAITRYLVSSYQVELANGMVVALPNVKVCAAGGVPAMSAEDAARLQVAQDELMARHRPPLAGEPHLLHRSIFRSPERAAGVERQSEAEGRWFSEILGPDGSVLKEVAR